MTPNRTPPVGAALILVLSILVAGWFLQQGRAEQQASGGRERLLEEVVDYLATQHVESLDADSLYDFAIDGILQRVGDPNTSLLNPTAYEDFRIRTEGDYGGVGLEISEREEFITVVSALPGAPAARAGLRVGDRIVEVAGESTRDWPVERAAEQLRGPPGTAVDVLIERPAVENPISFTIQREDIRRRAVRFAAILEEDIGYVPLDAFSQSSAEEIRAAADSLVEAGARSLVLDLRGNPGGVLDQGIGVADLFLDRGADVVETRGQGGRSNGVYSASQEDRYEGMPVAVLVDRGSASASEIVAGALQDHDRALIVGVSTYGKGSVQSLFPISGGNWLKITTARWYTPLGRSIERIADESTQTSVAQLADESSYSITITGQYAATPDTAGRPTIRSNAGRTLYGGGGIVPDLIIPMDTLSTDEQVAVRELFGHAPDFSTGVFNYAVEYLGARADTGSDFTIDDRDLDALYGRLVATEGFDVERDSFNRAERFVQLQLEAEIATQGWGDLVSFLRLVPYDAPLQTAIAALRRSTSESDVFTVAATVLAPDVLERATGATR